MGKEIRVPRACLLAVTFIALALRLFYFSVHPVGYDQNIIHTSDGHDYDLLAKSLLAGTGLSWDGHATSVITPVYPIFMRVCYAAWGPNVMVVRITQIMLSVFTCWLLWLWARRLVGEWGGLGVFCISAVYYPYVQMPCYVMTETLFAFLFALALWLAAYLSTEKRTWISAALGICVGIAILTRPAAMAIVFTVPLLLWGGARNKRWQCLAVFLLAVSVVWAPWVVRNYAVHDAFVPFSTNGGLNVFRGNNPNATGGSGGWTRQGPDTGPLPRTGHMSEVEADRYLKGLASDFIKQHPGTYLRLCVKRAVNLWRPYYDDARPIAKVLMFLSDVWLYPFALWGLFVAMRRGGLLARQQGWFILSLFVLFNGLYVSAITVIRYRYPIMPIVMLFAIVGLMDFVARHGARRSQA